MSVNFVCCLPYLDVIFGYLNISPLESARTVGIQNQMGIMPVISKDERCWGHDALWSGTEEIFRKRLNGTPMRQERTQPFMAV